MALSRSDVEKVAALARLDFEPAELETFTDQLGKIVSFVEQLSEVNTEGVEEMAHPLDVHSVLRSDTHCESLPRDKALQNAPNQDGEYFLVPPVFARPS